MPFLSTLVFVLDCHATKNGVHDQREDQNRSKIMLYIYIFLIDVTCSKIAVYIFYYCFFPFHSELGTYKNLGKNLEFLKVVGKIRSIGAARIQIHFFLIHFLNHNNAMKKTENILLFLEVKAKSTRGRSYKYL